MSALIGYISAIVSILGWGLQLVPMKRIKKYDPFYYQIIICFTVFVSSLTLIFFIKTLSFSSMAILSGLLWVTGNLLAILALQQADLSVGAPIWNGVGIVVSFLWGYLI